ncbi:MAG: dihydrofolate reductase [Verrucomicrobiota bacterium]|nr:dihydrofolate reductase [Verrucomicrobiota bacterium]
MNIYKAIAAMSENHVIGNAGDIPWHLPADFKWFKQTTMGAILVMGRKTYESIGRPLPGRETYVLSHHLREIPGVNCITSLDSLDSVDTEKVIWVAGGGEVYKQLLERCEEIYLTRVHKIVKGDAFFPEFEDQYYLDAIIDSNDEYSVEHWVKSSKNKENL